VNHAVCRRKFARIHTVIYCSERISEEAVMMKIRGFTLIELLITVAISAILLAVAAPGFQDLIVNNKMATQTNDLVSDLALARSEATKRGKRITVCTSTSGTACTASSWSNGRIVFIDNDGNGTVDAGDVVLRVTGALTGSNTLTAASFANANYVQYLPTGALDFTGSASTEGIFTLCKSSYKSRQIRINAIGRVRATQTTTVCS
jgi:type IV fimbrial biogenesis protein FimT